jgi:hypothetical protein
MIDVAMHILLDDRKFKIDALITFNARDFCDVCAARGVPLLDQSQEW